MVVMRSPEGVEKQISAEGADALVALGWERVEEEEKDVEEQPAVKRGRPARK